MGACSHHRPREGPLRGHPRRHADLCAASQAAQIPCDDALIHEMINLMDMNRDGVIGWDEFEVFLTEEFAAGARPAAPHVGSSRRGGACVLQ
jgi:hypothetical protein